MPGTKHPTDCEYPEKTVPALDVQRDLKIAAVLFVLFPAIFYGLQWLLGGLADLVARIAPADLGITAGFENWIRFFARAVGLIAGVVACFRFWPKKRRARRLVPDASTMTPVDGISPRHTPIAQLVRVDDKILVREDYYGHPSCSNLYCLDNNVYSLVEDGETRRRVVHQVMLVR